MNSTLSKFLIFTAGALVGSVVTWRILKPYYENLTNEEIESVKETFKGRYSEDEECERPLDRDATATSDSTVENLQKRYSQLVSSYTEEEVTDMAGTIPRRPYIIPPEEFGEQDGYDTETLIYYSDGVLTYDTGEVIEDVDDVVGLGFESHYGEYEEDSVHVRNEKHETDYEILRDLQRYSDVINTNPHQAEDE